jgi:hypothetical protein
MPCCTSSLNPSKTRVPPSRSKGCRTNMYGYSLLPRRCIQTMRQHLPDSAISCRKRRTGLLDSNKIVTIQFSGVTKTLRPLVHRRLTIRGRVVANLFRWYYEDVGIFSEADG